jgi:hypothetical protein
MASQTKDKATFDYLTFERNSRSFPPEELLKYRGLTYAWSGDGLRILASGNDELEVAEKLKKIGIGIDQVVFDNFPDCDSIF